MPHRDPSPPSFLHRGVVEGFYGTPYSHTLRLWLVEKLGRWGMNRYLHAPKDDPLHRAQWREDYDPAARREFAELIERGDRYGVAVGFAISPGLSIRYSSRDDVRALCGKLQGFRELGSRWLTLALDDVPSELAHAEDRRSFASLAEAHVTLAHAVREALGPEVALWLVPTDYVGCEPSAYLETLGSALDPEIEVGWTGRTVLSPTIRSFEAQRRAESLGRRLLVWDNVPAADGPMRPMLHLGPYAGRDADLATHVSGVLLNPMQHAHASGIALRTAADYLRDPAGYEPERAWREAIEELGEGAPRAFATFAAAHRFSPLWPEDRDPELEAALEVLRACYDDDPARAREPLERARALIDERLAAATQLRSNLVDRQLLCDIEPWIDAHHDETLRMQAALDALEALSSDAPRMHKVLAFSRFQGRLTRIEGHAAASYGPRRVLYPQLTRLGDDDACFGADRSLFVDCCLAEELVRFVESRALAALGQE